MYAIVKIGGNQYRVENGQKVQVDRLVGNTGDLVSFPALMVADKEEVKLGKDAENIPVKAKIVAHTRGVKVDVMRFRAKSRHRRKKGFRQSCTMIEIQSIGNAKLPEKATAKPEALSPKVKKTTPAKKAVAKKTPTK